MDEFNNRFHETTGPGLTTTGTMCGYYYPLTFHCFPPPGPVKQ